MKVTIGIKRKWDIEIDEQDLDLVEAYYWCVNKGYVKGDTRDIYVKPVHPQGSLHRAIAERMFGSLAIEGMDVDHINMVTTDNRRSNLRVSCRSSNKQNGRVRADSNSGYKGVTLRKDNGKWRAKIQLPNGGKRLSLGQFDDPVVAAKAYDDAARKYFGEFARLNFPLYGEQEAIDRV